MLQISDTLVGQDAHHELPVILDAQGNRLGANSVHVSDSMQLFAKALRENQEIDVLNLYVVRQRLGLHGLLRFLQQQEGALTSLCQALQALRERRET